MEAINTAPAALDFNARMAAWEAAFAAYSASQTDAAWETLDAVCVDLCVTNPIPAPAAYEYHAKPVGGGPCPVCGCAKKGLRASHRKIMPREGNYSLGWRYIKSVSVCFGTDRAEAPIR